MVKGKRDVVDYCDMYDYPGVPRLRQKHELVGLAELSGGQDS